MARQREKKRGLDSGLLQNDSEEREMKDGITLTLPSPIEGEGNELTSYIVLSRKESLRSQ
jgi:hypothetical protein